MGGPRMSTSTPVGTSAPANRRAPPRRPIPPHIRVLLDQIGASTVPRLVPAADVDALRCHTAASGFRNVYLSRNGHFVAKVKEGGRLYTVPGSRHPTPQQSACYVVAWYKARFGARWREAARVRKRLPWRVWRAPGGWTLSVWSDGRPALVGGRVFARRKMAVEFARTLLARGLDRPAWRAA
jgi:hypothetical protein